MTTRLLTAITSLALLASAAPATASAATATAGRADLGTSALPSVNRSALCGKQCTVAQISVKEDGKFVVAAPVTGGITSWSFRSGLGASGDRYALRVLRQSGTQLRAVASTPPVTVADDADTLRGPFALPAALQVRQGDKLGLQVLGGSAKSDQFDVPTIGSTTEDVYGPFYNPDLADGGPLRAPDFTSGGQQIPVQATIDTGQAAKPAPKLSNLKLRPKRFRSHTTVAYRLSAAATTTFRVQKAVRGRYVTLRGSFARAGKAGANRLRFGGRLRGRKLAPGRYRLTAQAKNAGGSSRTMRAAFRIVR